MESTSKELLDASGKTVDQIHVITTNAITYGKDGVKSTLEKRVIIDLTDGTSVIINGGCQ